MIVTNSNFLHSRDSNRHRDIASVGDHFIIGLRPTSSLHDLDRALLAELRPPGVALYKDNFRHDLPYDKWLLELDRLMGMSARRFDAIEFWWLSTTKEAACAVRLCLSRDKPEQGAIMAKRKKQLKVQKRGKLPRKVSKSARGRTRTVAKARPKLATGEKSRAERSRSSSRNC